jgi:glutamine cyclotransferase
MFKNFLRICFVAFVATSCDKTSSSDTRDTTSTTEEPASTATLNYSVLGSYPHDIQSFTEGLYVDNGQIFESTGSPEELTYTLSHLGPVDTTTGKIVPKASIDPKKYFGEGIAKLDGKIFQLTYKAQKCFVYDAKTYKPIAEYPYANAEGWGMTHDSTHLIMSDGTSKLTFFSPNDFSKVKELNVRENGYAVDKINELEYVDGFVYANIWTTNQIVKIDLNTGNVVAKVDLGPLYVEAQKQNPGLMEMNGIAYDPKKREFLVTGKLWPRIYRIKFL